MTVIITNINFAKLRDGKPNSPSPLQRIPAEQSPDPVYKNNYMRIVSFLKKMEDSGQTIPYTMNEALNDEITGRADIHVIIKQNEDGIAIVRAVFVTGEITAFKSNRERIRCLHVFGYAGENYMETRSEFETFLKDLRIKRKCDKIVFVGRTGWARLQTLGAKPVLQVYEWSG